MASKKISQLTPVTPLLTDLVPLDRPTTGPGAPVTGHATLADIQAAIGGGGGGATSGTFNEPLAAEFVTTASLSIAGGLGFSYAASQVGTDVYFFVSGAIGGKDSADPSVAVFGGDVVISGTLHGGSPLKIGGEVQLGSRTFATDQYTIIQSIDTGLNEITVNDESGFDPGDIVAYIYTGSQNSNLLHTTVVISTSPNVVTVTSTEALDDNGSSFNALTRPANQTVGESVLFNLTKPSSANFAFAAGSYTVAAGINSHAEGRKTAAIAPHSHAEGVVSLASGVGSHAEGVYTVALEYASHAEGSNTIASGSASHAEGASGGGGNLIARGYASHAEGYNTEAISDYSHAEGENTRAGYLGYGFGTPFQDFINPDNIVFPLFSYYDDVTGQFPGQNGEFLVDNTIYSYVGSNYDGGITYITGSGGDGSGTILTRLQLASLPLNADYELGEGQSSRGYQTYAIGQFSHAEGVDVRALGSYSHAEGEATTALGYGSHTEGYLTTAQGSYSHAEGDGTTASGYASHAEGYLTVAYEQGSHVEGIGTIASGTYQHAQGWFNLRNNDFSIFVIGNGTGDDDVDRSDVVRVNLGTPGSGSFEVTGTVYATVGFSGSLTQLTDGRSYLVAGTDISITTASDGQVTIDYIGTGGGGGGAQYWDSLQDGAIYTSGSALFRGPAGSNTSPADIGTDVFFYVSGSIGSKDTAVTGTAVFGGDVVISGTLHGGSPLKIGSGLQVTGTLDIKDGLSGSLTQLTDGRSYLVAGTNITITSESNGQVTISSTAGGGGTNYWTERSILRIYSSGSVEITGSLSVGEAISGGGTQANGLRSFAQGSVAKSPGSDSHAQGTSTTASGDNSHAEGAFTTASGFASHAEGAYTSATGDNSHAEGNSNTALGDYSHVEGQFNQSIGTGSHSEGRDTSSQGHYSHAEGSGSVSFGTGSHAEGFSTIASGSYQHVQGKFNLHNNDFSLFVIGDGTSNSNRSDIVRVNSGSTGGTGRFEVTGTLAATLGLSGSLTRLVNGSSYLVAGTNVTITTASSGQVTISSEIGDQFWQSTTAGSIFATGTIGAAISGSFRAVHLSASDGAIITGSVIIGQALAASGQSSHAEGYFTAARGQHSHAEGNITVARGVVSHTEGSQTETAVEAYGSHAEGLVTITSGNFSHAEGYATITVGPYSHAEGWGTIASGSYQHVQGKFNLRGNDFSLFVIGDGKSNEDYNRSDIVRVNSGSEVGTGRFEITGTLAVTRGISGSLTQLTNGSSYLIAGSGVTISTGALGAVTIGVSTSTAITGSFSVSGTIASNSTFTAYTGVRYFPDIVTSLPFTASLTDYIIAVSSSNPTAATNYGIELPGAEFGRTFVVKDISGSAANSNITVTAAGSNDIQRSIDGASNYILSVNRGSATFVYFGDTRGWGVI